MKNLWKHRNSWLITDKGREKYPVQTNRQIKFKKQKSHFKICPQLKFKHSCLSSSTDLYSQQNSCSVVKSHKNYCFLGTGSDGHKKSRAKAKQEKQGKSAAIIKQSLLLPTLYFPDEGIECESSKYWFYAKCQGISDTEYKNMQQTIGLWSYCAEKGTKQDTQELKLFMRHCCCWAFRAALRGLFTAVLMTACIVMGNPLEHWVCKFSSQKLTIDSSDTQL